MKKNYIHPATHVVTLNMSDGIMENQFQSASVHDHPNDGGGRSETQMQVNTDPNKRPAGMGGSAKRYNAWDTWDD